MVLSQEALLSNTLLEFFSEDIDRFMILVDIIPEEDKSKSTKKKKTKASKNNISLRIIEWFVINYSKKYNITYPLKKGNRTVTFNVHHSYDEHLNSYGKRLFDMFRRKGKDSSKTKPIYIDYIDDNGNPQKLKTMVCQLNFFKWCISNGILDYIKKHYKKIKDDLDSHNEKKKAEKAKKGTSSTPKVKVTKSTVTKFKKAVITI